MKSHSIAPFLIYIILSTVSCGGRRQLTAEEQIIFEKKYTKTQEAVSDWILNHAIYPNSYEPLSFSNYSESATMRDDEKIPKTQSYKIKHVHNILDKDSSATTYIGYFTLDYKYRVTKVETLESGAISGMSLSDIKEWTDKFGKSLTKEDSSLYMEKQLEAKEEFIHTFKNM